MDMDDLLEVIKIIIYNKTFVNINLFCIDARLQRLYNQDKYMKRIIFNILYEMDSQYEARCDLCYKSIINNYLDADDINKILKYTREDWRATIIEYQDEKYIRMCCEMYIHMRDITNEFIIEIIQDSIQRCGDITSVKKMQQIYDQLCIDAGGRKSNDFFYNFIIHEKDTIDVIHTKVINCETENIKVRGISINNIFEKGDEHCMRYAFNLSPGYMITTIRSILEKRFPGEEYYLKFVEWVEPNKIEIVKNLYAFAMCTHDKKLLCELDKYGYRFVDYFRGNECNLDTICERIMAIQNLATITLKHT